MRRDPNQLRDGRNQRVRVDVVHEGIEERRCQMVKADEQDLQEKLNHGLSCGL